MSLIILPAVVIAVLYMALKLGLRLNNGLNLAPDSVSLQNLQPEAKLNILVVGDSTGIGTGAALPTASVTGRIASTIYAPIL